MCVTAVTLAPVEIPNDNLQDDHTPTDHDSISNQRHHPQPMNKDSIAPEEQQEGHSYGKFESPSPAAYLLSCRGKSCCVMVLVITIASAVLVLALLLRPLDNDTTSSRPSVVDSNLRAFADQDVQVPSSWNTGGRNEGLKLTVINALESHWHEFFYTAVDQWDSGSPDALTLSTIVADEVPQSSNCTGINGAMKLCNGDYGESHWRGVNKILRDDNGFIISSAARMNDFYLTGNRATDFPEMAYTMCHEMGHGFGVPHTDMDFFNEDLGNCMDYTNDPAANKQPDKTNFQFLAQLYGTVGQTASSLNSEESSTGTSGNDEKNGERTRRLQRRELDSSERVPGSVMVIFESVDQLVDNGLAGAVEGSWRKLHDSTHGEVHEIDAGGGFSIRVHLLKYVPPDA